MKYIAHRGNIIGPNPKTENTLSAIDNIVSLGLDCEIDIWAYKNYDSINPYFVMGHEEKKGTIVNINDILFYRTNLFVHCKNDLAFESLLLTGLNVFIHDKQPVAPVFKRLIYSTKKYSFVSPFNWLYPGQEVTSSNDIAVVTYNGSYNNPNKIKHHGICTDSYLTFLAISNNLSK